MSADTLNATMPVFVHGGPPFDELDLLWREYVCGDGLRWAPDDLRIIELHLHWQPDTVMAGKIGSWRIDVVTAKGLLSGREERAFGIKERTWPS